MALSSNNHVTCPVCKNIPEKRVVVTTVGNTRTEKKCAKCLGIGKIPKPKGS